MINLLPKDTVFFDLFENLVRHVVSAAENLQRLSHSFPNGSHDIQRIRDDEHEADKLSHQALDRLDRTFITPFDREDIHELVGGLDDIVDSIDAIAKRFPLYHVKQMQPAFQKQCELLVLSTKAVADAVMKLRKARKLSELSQKLIEIHHHESVGDDNHHAAVSELYGGEYEPLEVMKWKEFYEMIEEAIDACEDVGNTIERIVLKNG
jgi:predicted phosphate transport protein (TIGR00153 family)